MKSSDKMSMKTRRKLRRALALVLAVALVAGLGLSYSPDRVLRAEEISAEAGMMESQSAGVEEAPKKEEPPAPVEEEAPAQETVTVQEETPAPSGDVTALFDRAIAAKDD